MIRISDAAQAHFAKLLANQEEGTQIRVFVINPGTPNAECGVSYCPPDAVEATDTALKFDLLTAYVDELSAPYLEDAEIDFVTDQLGSQLTLKAPNAISSPWGSGADLWSASVGKALIAGSSGRQCKMPSTGVWIWSTV